jgi:hypothetical protein
MVALINADSGGVVRPGRAWLLYDNGQLIAGQLLAGNEDVCEWG